MSACIRLRGRASVPPAFASRRRCSARNRGFTLIELMITLAVAAILAMIAVPSFQHIVTSSHLSGISNALANDLQFARTEAVSRQVNVAVAASSGNWENGWRVQIPGATPDVLRRHAGISAPYAVNAGAIYTVTYQPQGSLDLPDKPNAVTCFVIYTHRGEHNLPRFLKLLPAGALQQVSNSTPPQGCPSPPT